MTEQTDKQMGRVLLTGATGFVGRHVFHALAAAGYDVHCASRHPDAAARMYPDRNWVHLDVEDKASLDQALAGCEYALFLVHGMDHAKDYPEREKHGAETFAACAQEAGIKRVVYLGGVVPQKKGGESRHLRSRRKTGETLRKLGPSTVELRAAMIVGQGSASWIMVRDLAARLPAMILPRWLRNVSYPVSIYDVVTALVESLTLELDGNSYLELPGPEELTHREVLNRTAGVLNRRPIMWNVPVLSPRLSSYWIALVTRTNLALAKELVEGVKHDLIPTGKTFWDLTNLKPMAFQRAIELATTGSHLDDFPSASSLKLLKTIGVEHRQRRSQ